MVDGGLEGVKPLGLWVPVPRRCLQQLVLESPGGAGDSLEADDTLPSERRCTTCIVLYSVKVYWSQLSRVYIDLFVCTWLYCFCFCLRHS